MEVEKMAELLRTTLHDFNPAHRIWRERALA